MTLRQFREYLHKRMFKAIKKGVLTQAVITLMGFFIDAGSKR